VPVIILVIFLSFSLSAWLTWRFCDPTSRFHILDHPNERSLHERPTPRGGGLAIFAGIAAGTALAAWPLSESGYFLWLLFAMLLVAGVSSVDDRRQVPVIVRLATHVIASYVLIGAGFSLRILDLPGIGFPLAPLIGNALTLVFVVWMINLYNFMDGMDGFAAGMAVIGFGAFALLGWQSGQSTFMLLNLITAAAAGGFLLFNFPPARIFMGDAGSSTLGLLAAAFSLWGARDRIFPLWAAVLIFSPFVVDATVTLIRRLLRGERVWQAHKTHYYQRLVQAGWGHRRTVLWEYVLMAACAGSAIWAVRQTETVQWWVNGFWAAAYAMLIAMVHRLAPSRSSFDGRL
jgi:UDP-N-acetylmuramyl pentapeptide phosphotransferase/UDP-N-acetylglucosamine-1-phosphate transferase